MCRLEEVKQENCETNYPDARMEDLLEGVSGCDTFSVID